MIVCLYIELKPEATTEQLSADLACTSSVKGWYDCTAWDGIVEHFSTLEDIECHLEGK